MLTNKKNSTLRLVQLSILVAIVIVLQLAGTAVKLNILGTSVSLVLIPIVLGAMLLGPKAGAVLGFIFGVITYLMGVFGLDAFTFILFQDHPVLTALICIVKGTAAGLVAGFVYEACQKAWNGKKNLLATFLASAAAPSFFLSIAQEKGNCNRGKHPCIREKSKHGSCLLFFVGYLC